MSSTPGGERPMRAPLTTTHHHGHVLVREDINLGLIRISKNASTESKNRLGVERMVHYRDFTGPSVTFLRSPVKRFISSIPETMLRITYPEVAHLSRTDQVVCPEDVYFELCDIAKLDITTFADAYLALVEYAFFDAHHEPQTHFIYDRCMRPRINPHLYLVESFDAGIDDIAKRFNLPQLSDTRGNMGNEGGKKAEVGATPLKDLVRNITGTGVRKRLGAPGPLAVRYADELPAGNPTMGKMNTFSNRLSKELKEAQLPASFTRRVEALYAGDIELWQRVTQNTLGITLDQIDPFA